MIARLWTISTLGYAWLWAAIAIAVSQAMSAILMPRSWEFFWLIPVDWASPLAMARVIGTAWIALWGQRPFEALTLTVFLLLLAFTLVWVVARLGAAGHHAIITRRAV